MPKITSRTLSLSSLLLLSPAATADALLFPYVATSDTVVTVVSVVNKDVAATSELFTQYYHKGPTDDAGSCTATTRRSFQSGPNDLVSFEINGKFTGNNASTTGGPLFNDPASNVDYSGDNFTMGPVTGPRRAFLIVDDDGNNDSQLYGEVVLIETVSGAAWGYRAYNSQGGVAANPDFDNGFDTLGEVLDSTESAPTTLLPPSQWNTLFFVTPVTTDQRLCEDCSVKVTMSQDKTGATSGLYDRDGNPIAGAKDVNITCVGAIDMNELLSATALNRVNNQGGWGYIQIDTGVLKNAQNSAVVLKLEFNLSSTNTISPNPGNTFNGIVNTVTWLRNNGSNMGTNGF